MSEEKGIPSIKDLVKNNFVKFDSYRQGLFYYILRTGEYSGIGDEYVDYQFTIPIDDIGTATLLSEDKALTYMRWIRKALDNKTLIKL